MVKKHSNLLGRTMVEVQDAADVEMDAEFWHDVFDLYFIRGKESRGRHDDDLLFFVRRLVGFDLNLFRYWIVTCVFFNFVFMLLVEFARIWFQ